MGYRCESLWWRVALLEWAMGHRSDPKVVTGNRIVQGVVSLKSTCSPSISRDQHRIESSTPIVCD